MPSLQAVATISNSSRDPTAAKEKPRSLNDNTDPKRKSSLRQITREGNDNFTPWVRTTAAEYDVLVFFLDVPLNL